MLESSVFYRKLSSFLNLVWNYVVKEGCFPSCPSFPNNKQEHLIENEVSILRRVKHPNIIMLIEEMDTATELYLVMELVKVGSLLLLNMK